MSLSSTSGLPKSSSRAQTTSSTQRNKLKLEKSAIGTQRNSLNANDLISVESGTKQTSLGFIPQKGHSGRKSQEGLKVSDICSENGPVARKRQKSQDGLKVPDIFSENGPVDCKNKKSQKGLKVSDICSEKGPVARKRQKSQDGLKVPDICSENGPVACKNQKSQKGLKVPDICSENGPVARKRQKSQDGLKVPDICPENGPVVRKRQKSQDGLKVPDIFSENGPVDCKNQNSQKGLKVPDICSENGPVARKRQKSQDGLKVPDICSENGPVDCKNKKSQKGLKVPDICSENGPLSCKSQDHKKSQGQSHEEPSLVNEVLPKKSVGSSKDMTHVPMSEKRTKLQRIPISTKTRSCSRKPEQVVESNVYNVMSQSMTSSKGVRRYKSKSQVVSSSACDLNVLRDTQKSEKLREKQNVVNESKSPKNNKSEQESEDGSAELCFFEEIVLEKNALSHNNEYGYIWEDIAQRVRNPTLDPADIQNVTPVNLLPGMNQNKTTVESMQNTPISDSKNENNTLSTISDIDVEPNLVNMSPIRECAIVIKRLHQAEISKYSPPIKQLEKDDTSCKNVCVDPAISNQLASVHQPSRPKLNKASILKRKIIDKSPSFKQKKTDNVDWLGLDRTVSLRIDKPMVITKIFNEPKVEKEPVNLILHENNDYAVKRKCTEPKVGKEPVKLILHKNNDSAVKRKCTEPKVEKEPVNLKRHENNDSTLKRKCPESNHGQTTNKTYITFNNNPNQSQKQFKNTQCNGEVTQLKRFKDKNLQKSIDEKQLKNPKAEPPKVEKEPVKLKLHENNDSVVKRKYPESNDGQTTNKTYITLNNNPNQSQEQFKNRHFNGEVTQLKRFEGKNLQKSIDEKQLKNGTVPSELKLRNRITLKEKDGFNKVVTHNNPLSIQCNFNARSNLEVDSTQLQIQEKEPPKDFRFALPKPIIQQVVQPIQEDDDDASSVISLYASSDILNYVNNDQYPEQNKTTGTKFDRLSKYSHDNDEDFKKSNNYIFNSYKAGPSGIRGTNAEISKRNNLYTSTSKYSHDNDKEEDVKKSNNYTFNSNNAGPSGIRGTNAEISKRNNLFTSSPMTQERVACLDQFLDKDPLENSPFKGYCMLYLRTSIDEHPCCLMMHEVPNHVLSNINSPQDVKRTDCAIGEIMKENFINPPVDLVLLFVSFCVQFSKKLILVRLGQCLKNNYDGDTQKAHEIWYNFFKGIINSDYDPMPNIHRCRFISMILQNVFEEIVDNEVFTVVLKALVTLKSYFMTRVQLLMCINFLSEKGQKNNFLNLIPLEFATAIINQCLDTFSHNNKKAFVYRVLKTFFMDLDYARRLYCHDKNTFSLFVETVESNNIGSLSFPIKQLQMSGLETSSLENLEQTKTYSDSPIQQRDAPGRTIKCANDPRSLCAALERNFEIRELNPNEIFTHFTSTFKSELFYRGFSLLRDPVKESLSGVIMSFISYEADKKRWDVCLKLYKSLLCFNPTTIKNFYGNNSPVSNLLTVVSVYLNNNSIMEALCIFTKYNLCKDHLYWKLEFCPYDLERRKLVCATFRDALHSVDTQELYTVFMMLIPLQKSLEEPIDLTLHIITLINGLIEKRLESKVAKLIGLIFDEKKSKSFFLTSHHLYRALVVILCNAEEYSHAAMLYAKAQIRVPLYPQLPTRITDIGREMSVEFYSCLTKQEMLVVFFALLKLYGNEIKNIGFSANFKVYRKHPDDGPMPYILNPYLSLEDDSITAANQRFKQAVRELIPNAIFKESGLNAIEVEKKSLQEYVYKLNQTDSSGED